MDRARFDALTRVLAGRPSRRSLLASLFAVALVTDAPDSLKANGVASRHRHRHRGTPARRAKVRGEQVPARCYPGKPCVPGKGKNTAKCDFTGSTSFTGADLSSSNLSEANLTGVDATHTSFKSANLSGACLVDAVLRDANLKQATTTGAIFCRTVMPDGSINNAGCARGSACCPTGIVLGNPCGAPLGGACLGGSTCQHGVCACPADKPAACNGMCQPCCCAATDCCHNLTCAAGDQWDICGAQNQTCQACAVGEVCAGSSGACQSCASRTGATFCDARSSPDAVKCGEGCYCSERASGGGSVCWRDPAGCSGTAAICTTDADCGADGLCIKSGTCDASAGCAGGTVCVFRCSTA
jgi:uncharacterized protein YjbI with pentapeptide repeats